MIGDIAVPVNIFEVSISFDQSLRHFTRAGRRVERRQHRARAERVDDAVGDKRRGERPLRHVVGVLVLGEGGLVARRPDRLAGREVQRGHDLVGLLPAVDEDAAVGHDRRRVALARLQGPLVRAASPARQLERSRRPRRRRDSGRATAATGRPASATPACTMIARRSGACASRRPRRSPTPLSSSPSGTVRCSRWKLEVGVEVD